jgi:hypothetical protein
MSNQEQKQEYIHYLEKEIKKLRDENLTLRRAVELYEQQRMWDYDSLRGNQSGKQ